MKETSYTIKVTMPSVELIDNGSFIAEEIQDVFYDNLDGDFNFPKSAIKVIIE